MAENELIAHYMARWGMTELSAKEREAVVALDAARQVCHTVRAAGAYPDGDATQTLMAALTSLSVASEGAERAREGD